VNKYRSTGSYKRVNPKTGLVESTSRFIEGFYDNKGACQTALNMQIHTYDDVVGKINFKTEKVK